MGALKVTEIFYSICGEGRRVGTPSIFVRLSGCSAKAACFAGGVLCDTEYDSGSDMSIEALIEALGVQMPNVPIVWTGGEPMDQLTPDVVRAVKEAGWKYHAIETSGIRPMSMELRSLLDWVCVSPKVSEYVLGKHFPCMVVSELRYVRSVGQSIPRPILSAKYKYISPHDDGTGQHLAHCIRLCLEHPEWNLSTQQHKVWGLR